MSSSLKTEASSLLSLAVPMMIAQGGLMAMGVVDSLLIGRVGSLEMGSVALGNGITGVVIVLGIGLVMGIEPLVSQAHGAGEGTRRWLWQGSWLGLFMAVPLSLMIVAATLLFEPFGVSQAIADTTTAYLYARLPGLLFNTLYSTHRSFLTCIGRVRPVLIAVIAANVVNAGADALLIFHFGLGAVGVGLATSVCWVLMFLITSAAIGLHEPQRPQREDLLRIGRLGLPIGLQLVVEVGIFAATSMMIARFGEAQLAGHQIAVSLASAVFMCALGVAVATTARVGQHIGGQAPDRARRTGFVGMGIGALAMGSGGLIFLVFAQELATFFAPTDPEAARVGATLLRIAAFFSISDGIQVCAAGALRGAGDTRWPFLANAVAHWLVGLPCGLWFAHSLDMGPAGYWWGLTAGLTGTALILTFRFHWLSKRPMHRV